MSKLSFKLIKVPLSPTSAEKIDIRAENIFG